MALQAFRINILPDDFLGEYAPMFSGSGRILNAPRAECPNCQLPMFPALNFESTDLVDCRERFGCEFVSFLFCPSCAHHLAPYWVRLRKMEVIGGLKDGGEVMVDVCRPYKARLIELREIFEIPTFLDRNADCGIYHQIGGAPIVGKSQIMECCDCGRPMKFAGILDSDDLNVPLYENAESPLSLMIADSNCLNVYACVSCAVLGMQIARN